MFDINIYILISDLTSLTHTKDSSVSPVKIKDTAHVKKNEHSEESRDEFGLDPIHCLIFITTSIIMFIGFWIRIDADKFFEKKD